MVYIHNSIKDQYYIGWGTSGLFTWGQVQDKKFTIFESRLQDLGDLEYHHEEIAQQLIMEHLEKSK